MDLIPRQLEVLHDKFRNLNVKQLNPEHKEAVNKFTDRLEKYAKYPEIVPADAACLQFAMDASELAVIGISETCDLKAQIDQMHVNWKERDVEHKSAVQEIRAKLNDFVGDHNLLICRSVGSQLMIRLFRNLLPEVAQSKAARLSIYDLEEMVARAGKEDKLVKLLSTLGYSLRQLKHSLSKTMTPGNGPAHPYLYRDATCEEVDVTETILYSAGEEAYGRESVKVLFRGLVAGLVALVATESDTNLFLDPRH